MTIAGGREIANKDASVKVFALIIFIEVLLQMITERKCATLARSPCCTTAVISDLSTVRALTT
jgi:hypothetical protein